MFERYTNATGVEIKFITGKAGALLERIKAEGADTPADIFMTVDAGNLWQAAQANVLRPTPSTELEENVPAHLKDPENRWFGLSVRARALVYNTDSGIADKLTSYENLAEQQWEGKLVLRTSRKVYN